MRRSSRLFTDAETVGLEAWTDMCLTSNGGVRARKTGGNPILHETLYPRVSNVAIATLTQSRAVLSPGRRPASVIHGPAVRPAWGHAGSECGAGFRHGRTRTPVPGPVGGC